MAQWPKTRAGVGMYSMPLILPLNTEGTIYALQDEQGRRIGTGTREVCELLLHIVTKQTVASRPEELVARLQQESGKFHRNVRSAIAI